MLWRATSPHNSVLLTERCDNYCLMCSQPPRDIDDGYLLDRTFELIRQLPPDVEQILYTGGEPTLYGDRFLDLLSTTSIACPSPRCTSCRMDAASPTTTSPRSTRSSPTIG